MPLSADDDQFRTELTALIPSMRAFALGLCRDHAAADDLAQEALIKAWTHRSSFTLGTNMKAWTFFIVRTTFYSERRRSWRSAQLDPEVANNTLVAVSSHTARLELDELRRALGRLPVTQREAIILVGAGGLTYDEAAEICGVQVGTIKSRVSRARSALTRLVEEGSAERDAHVVGAAMPLIEEELQRLQTRIAVS